MQAGVLSDITNEVNRLPNNEESNTDEIDDTNTIEMTLNVNDTYEDWNAVDIAVNMYARQKGFVAIKRRKDLDAIDKTIIRRRVYSCWKAGTNNPKKVEDINLHRDSVSTKTNCPWQVGFYFGKNTNIIHLTKFDNNHNHRCDPVTIDLAPKNSRLPKTILDRIEHYTTNGRLGAGQQYDLLVKEFPEYLIKKKNLYNAIQKFRGVRIHDESDAAMMFLYLIKQREQDPDYVVIPRLEGLSNELTGLFWMTSQQRNELWPKFRDVIIHDNTAKTNRYEMALSLFVGIDNNYKTRVLAQALTKYETQADYSWVLQCTLEATNNLSPIILFSDSDPGMIAAVQVVYPETRHLLCIYHIVENVKKKARSKLHGEMVNKFVEDFYHMRNSCNERQFEARYNEMLTKYEKCRPYLEKKLYPNRESWARYAIAKVFTAGVESTQRVESLNGVLKKHVDRGSLLRELVKEIERELDKEAQYSRIRDYYGSNPSTGLSSTYNTIFKDIDSVLKDFLAPIPLSLQRAQMKQALLYQGILVSIEQVNESYDEPNSIVEHIYDRPQIRLQELLLGIDHKEIQEIWEVDYIVPSSTSKPHYVVVLRDLTLLCTCMYIINHGMPCRHQYRILLQSNKAIFHIGFIHTRWFESVPLKTNTYITIARGTKAYTTNPLLYIDQMRTGNVYTLDIRENFNKKLKFGTLMSVAKTSVQIAVAEGITSELTGILTEFIIKYRRNTGLNIEEVHYAPQLNNEIQEPSSVTITDNCNVLNISNPEYHKPKGRPPKRYKSSVEEKNVQHISSFKTCSYCLEKGHNIRGCKQYKADSVDKEN